MKIMTIYPIWISSQIESKPNKCTKIKLHKCDIEYFKIQFGGKLFRICQGRCQNALNNHLGTTTWPWFTLQQDSWKHAQWKSQTEKVIHYLFWFIWHAPCRKTNKDRFHTSGYQNSGTEKVKMCVCEDMLFCIYMCSLCFLHCSFYYLVILFYSNLFVFVLFYYSLDA